MGVKKGGGQETVITYSRPKQGTWGDGRIDWQERQARLNPVPILVRWGEAIPGCLSHVGCFLCIHQVPAREPSGPRIPLLHCQGTQPDIGALWQTRTKAVCIEKYFTVNS